MNDQQTPIEELDTDVLLEHTLTDHIERENTYVLTRMEHDQPPFGLIA